jgi:uncharacterized protein YdcH (DUF465 family)
MGETSDQTAGSLPATGQTSPDGAGTTSTPAPATYSEEDVQKAVSDALAKAGRERKAIEDENATLKGRVSSFDINLAEIQQDRARLKATLEELGAKDPDKAKVVQKINELDAQIKANKADREKLEAERLQHGEMVKIAAERTRADNIKEIAAKYEGSDAAILKELCDKAGIHDAARIKDIAATLWKKPVTAPPAIKPDSGITSGSGIDISKLSPTEKIEYGLAHPKK